MRRLNFWLGIGISIGLLILIFYQVDREEFLKALARAHLPLAFLAATPVLATFIVRTLRWQYLLRPVREPAFMPALSATCIGFMANMILPARLGEFVRAWSLGRKERISFGSCFASIVLERLFDGSSILVVLVFLFFSMDLAPSVAQKLRLAGVLSLLFYLLVIGILVMMRVRTEPTARVFRFLLRPLGSSLRERLMGTLESFVSGIRLMSRPWDWTMVCALSAALWLSMVLFNQMVLLSFGMELPWVAPFFLLVMQALSVMLPSSPGFVGTVHYAIVLALGFYGVPRELGLSIAIIMHGVNYVAVVVPGFVFLWGEGLSLRSLGKAGEAVKL
ncbi:MAG: lysylphosphatidylglycerol synthase transmembrane domain-containing protein, partial [Nitrospinota bacterium]